MAVVERESLVALQSIFSTALGALREVIKMETKKQITARIPLTMVRHIRHLAVDWDIDLGKAIERLLAEALDRYSNDHV